MSEFNSILARIKKNKEILINRNTSSQNNNQSNNTNNHNINNKNLINNRKQTEKQVAKPDPITQKKNEIIPAQIKIKTQITSNYLFHYAHFTCDFLFPLVCEKLDKCNIIREKNLNQTIGNFNKLLMEVTNKKYDEIEKDNYNRLNIKEIDLPLKEKYTQKDFLYFQKFMWDKFVLNNEKYKKVIWPQVILIKRTTQQIINIEEYEKRGYPHRTNNGSQRREIDEFSKVEKVMKSKFGDKMKTISLENSSLESQVNLFYNAKLIVAAHGAALINLFYCQKGTSIIESIGLPWYFFDTISSNLALNHVKCENKLESLIFHINSFNSKRL